MVGLVLFAATIIFIRDFRVLERYRYTIALASLALLVLPRLPGIGSQVTGCDAVDGAGFVVVGQVTAHPDRTDDGVVVVADQDAAGDGHEVAVGE